MVTDYYVDTSVGMRILLGHSPAAARWFDRTVASADDRVVSSRLLRTQMTRTLRHRRRITAMTLIAERPGNRPREVGHWEDCRET